MPTQPYYEAPGNWPKVVQLVDKMMFDGWSCDQIYQYFHYVGCSSSLTKKISLYIITNEPISI